MKVLITGGAGFVGSNIAEELVKNYDVTILDNFFLGNLDNLAAVKDKVKIIKGDIKDEELLKKACRESARQQRRQLQGRLDQARRELEAAGVTILRVDQRPFRDRVLAMHARYAKKLGAESLLKLITPAPDRPEGKEAAKP